MPSRRNGRQRRAGSPSWQSSQWIVESPSELLERFGTGEAPIRVEAFLDELGVDVVLAPDLPQGVAGELHVTDATAAIKVAQHLDVPHQRYALAYLLGSLLLQEEGACVRIAESPLATANRSSVEFAHELLLPAELVVRYSAPEAVSPEALAQAFLVPLEVMRRRLRQLKPSEPLAVPARGIAPETPPPMEAPQSLCARGSDLPHAAEVMRMEDAIQQLAAAAEQVLQAWNAMRPHE